MAEPEPTHVSRRACSESPRPASLHDKRLQPDQPRRVPTLRDKSLARLWALPFGAPRYWSYVTSELFGVHLKKVLSIKDHSITLNLPACFILRSQFPVKGSVMDDALHNEHFTLSPIGHVVSDYPDKFGIPRQPGLAPAAQATLVLTPPYNDPLTVRGLEDFSHLWLTFIFHQSPERWSPLIRPPRLGGNKKVGVFASRSTHRPNRLGLSLVALTDINTQNGVTLTLSGCDLVSGTPF